MDTLALGDIVRKYDGIVVDYRDDGIILLDRSGMHLKHIPHELESTYQEETQRFFVDLEAERERNEKKDNDPKRDSEILDLVLNITLESLAADSICEGITYLMKGLCERQIVNLVISFQEPPTNWPTVLDSFLSQLSDLVIKGRVSVTLSGPFAKMDESSKEYLMNHDVHLIYLHGPQDISDAENSTALKTIYDIADFGFCMPVAWQIHSKNIGGVCDLIDDYMFASYNAGFALPLISDSPYYALFKDGYHFPQSREYLELLTDVYKKYNYYDDVLFPLSCFASNAYCGGVSDITGTTKSIQLLVLPDGDIKVFGHIPFLGVSCTNLSELRVRGQQDVYSYLIDQCKTIRSEHLSPCCQQCQWKNICGGEYTKESLEPFRIHCEITAFFSRVFLWQRSEAIRVVTEEKEPQADKTDMSNEFVSPKA